MTEKRQKLVIDCDAGVDDAVAIMLTLSRKDVQLIAVTCLHGNTQVESVIHNVQRVLKKCKREDIPVFSGANVNLLGIERKTGEYYHGKDGLGDVPDDDPPDPTNIQDEHAVQALLRLSLEHEGEIILNTLGPLTNVALAMRMDGDFTKRLKEIVVMGGNVSGKGNASPCAEFNFMCDPEAASIVLEQALCPVMVIPYETCAFGGMSWDWLDNWTSKDTVVTQFIKAIIKYSADIERYQWKRAKFVLCDPISTAIAINRNVSIESRTGQIHVEREGKWTRGQMVELSNSWSSTDSKGAMVEVVVKIDSQKYLDMLGTVTETL